MRGDPEVWERIEKPSEEAILEQVLWTPDGFIVCYRIGDGLCFRLKEAFIREWRLAAPTRWQRLRGEPVI